MNLEIRLKNGEKIYFSPEIIPRSRYKHWISIGDLKRCQVCKDNQGKIWPIEEIVWFEPPIHSKCRCKIETMKSIVAGTATVNGNNGADKTLKDNGTLPDYYVSMEYALEKGWKPKKSPMNFVPGKMISGGIYDNDDGRLPQSIGRIWYEADINYYFGKRNGHRVVWSSDGLIFVTYDHYFTFYEII